MSQVNKQLASAVRYLYGKGIISKDRDIAEMTGYNKTSVSSYLSGNVKPSANFIAKFEQVFKVDVSKFKERPEDEPIEIKDPMRALSERVLQLFAISRVNQSLLIEILANQTDKTVMELQRVTASAMDAEIKELMDELKRDQ